MRVSRRQLLGATGAVAAVSAARLNAAPVPGLVLVDPGLTQADRKVLHPLAHPVAVSLEPDVVRQWRRDLGRTVEGAGGATAYVRWDKALLLTGLARESGLAARQRRLGRSLFELRIG